MCFYFFIMRSKCLKEFSSFREAACVQQGGEYPGIGNESKALMKISSPLQMVKQSSSETFSSCVWGGMDGWTGACATPDPFPVSL